MWGVWGIGVPESSVMWKGLRGLGIGQEKVQSLLQRRGGSLAWGGPRKSMNLTVRIPCTVQCSIRGI